MAIYNVPQQVTAAITAFGDSPPFVQTPSQVPAASAVKQNRLMTCGVEHLSAQESQAARGVLAKPVQMAGRDPTVWWKKSLPEVGIFLAQKKPVHTTRKNSFPPLQPIGEEPDNLKLGGDLAGMSNLTERIQICARETGCKNRELENLTKSDVCHYREKYRGSVHKSAYYRVFAQWVDSERCLQEAVKLASVALPYSSADSVREEVETETLKLSKRPMVSGEFHSKIFWAVFFLSHGEEVAGRDRCAEAVAYAKENGLWCTADDVAEMIAERLAKSLAHKPDDCVELATLRRVKKSVCGEKVDENICQDTPEKVREFLGKARRTGTICEVEEE